MPSDERCARTSGDARCVRPSNHPGGCHFSEDLPGELPSRPATPAEAPPPMSETEWGRIRRDLHAGRLLNHDDREKLIEHVEHLRRAALAGAPPADIAGLLDRYQHAIEELDAWSHERDRVDELNAAVTAARADVDRALASLQQRAERAEGARDENGLVQMSAADEADAERVARILAEDYGSVYVSRFAEPIDGDAGWCVFYSHRRAALASPAERTGEG